MKPGMIRWNGHDCNPEEIELDASRVDAQVAIIQRATVQAPGT